MFTSVLSDKLNPVTLQYSEYLPGTCTCVAFLRLSLYEIVFVFPSMVLWLLESYVKICITVNVQCYGNIFKRNIAVII